MRRPRLIFLLSEFRFLASVSALPVTVDKYNFTTVASKYNCSQDMHNGNGINQKMSLWGSTFPPLSLTVMSRFFTLFPLPVPFLHLSLPCFCLFLSCPPLPYVQLQPVGLGRAASKMEASFVKKVDTALGL